MSTKKILGNSLFIVVHALGVLLSIASIVLLLVQLFGVSPDIPLPEVLNIVLAVGVLIGLFFIGIITVLFGRNKAEKRIGYIYLLFWLSAVIITLKVILVDKG